MITTFKYYIPSKKGVKVPYEMQEAYERTFIAVLDEDMSVAEACEKTGVKKQDFLNKLVLHRRKNPAIRRLLCGRHAHERDASLYELNPKTGKMAVSRATVIRMRNLRDKQYTRFEIAELIGVAHSIVAKYTEPAGSCYYSYRADPTEPFGQPHA